jgi:hypothetical protein
MTQQTREARRLWIGLGGARAVALFPVFWSPAFAPGTRCLTESSRGESHRSVGMLGR